MGFSIGKVLNSITGVTNSAAQAQGYALQNAAVNNAYQKEFAQNGVQWRAADLEKAGFNRALAATGGAATASGGGSFGGSTGSSSGINPIGLIGSLVEMKNQTNATNAQTKVADAQALKLIAETKALPEQLRIQLINALANQSNSETNAINSEAGILGKVIGNKNATEITRDIRKNIQRKNGDWFHFEIKRTQ